MFRPTNESSGAAPAASASGAIGFQGMRAFSDGSRPADPADKLLPGAPKARQNAEKFRRALEDARAIGSVTLDKLQAAMERKGRAQQRVQELTSGAWNLPENHPSVVMAMRDLDAATEELQKAQNRSESARDERQDLAHFTARMERWLAALPDGIKIVDIAVAAPKLLKGELSADGATRHREELAQARARRREIEAAAITSAEARSIIRKDVEALIARGRPSVDAIIEGGSEAITWPLARAKSPIVGAVVINGAVAPVTNEHREPEIDTLALLAWLNRDLVMKRLDEELAEAQDDSRALSREQRQKKLQQIDEEILALERAEAVLVADAGMSPRGDMDVRAALGCAGPAMEVDQ